MLNALKIQFKNILRDKFVLVSVFLPIVLAIVIRLYTPSIAIETSFAYIEDNIPASIILKLEKIANVESYESHDRFEKRVLENSDEVIGILYNEDTSSIKFLLQGNEMSRTKKEAEVIGNYLKGNIVFQDVDTEILIDDDNEMIFFLMTLTIMMAFFMGSVINGFNIVSEKEEGIANINNILPMGKGMYILQKCIMGFIGSVILGVITFLIFMGIQIPFFKMITFIVVSGALAAILGLYLGLFSSNLISVIMLTKVVLLLFIFVPIIGFFMPQDLNVIKNLFYIIPSYPIFKGIWILVTTGESIAMLGNSLIIICHIIIGYCLYLYLFNKIRLAKNI